MSLIWKTNWTESDNYARNGTDDITRLRDNLNTLILTINETFSTRIPLLSNFAPNGFLSVPFASALNQIEQRLNAMRISSAIPWMPFSGTWTAYGPAPDYSDINRWETNGKAIEEYLNTFADYSNYTVAATFFAGSDKTTTLFSRGR